MIKIVWGSSIDPIRSILLKWKSDGMMNKAEVDFSFHLIDIEKMLCKEKNVFVAGTTVICADDVTCIS